MSSQFQITNNKGDYNKPLVEVSTNFEDIYGAPHPPNYQPIDLNAIKEIQEYIITESSGVKKQIWARVRFRDRNLQWSEWSDERELIVNINAKYSYITKYKLYDNSQNLDKDIVIIKYDLPETSFVTLRVYNAQGDLVEELENRKIKTGTYKNIFDISNLENGLYYIKLKANNYVVSRPMTIHN